MLFCLPFPWVRASSLLRLQYSIEVIADASPILTSYGSLLENSDLAPLSLCQESHSGPRAMLEDDQVPQFFSASEFQISVLEDSKLSQVIRLIVVFLAYSKLTFNIPGSPQQYLASDTSVTAGNPQVLGATDVSCCRIQLEFPGIPQLTFLNYSVDYCFFEFEDFLNIHVPVPRQAVQL
ncbi:MAG: hypothetical protein EZS28_018000 [Streblomastix strix]|uniref:Uncharacterized protein n=1 Tax=Streblomastix strix TaxID=222440 RepID=A0A5J4VVB4_9EUKA|nr:MAG: hypothetical protein EZS28_018000 [Streblomastix strix]